MRNIDHDNKIGSPKRIPAYLRDTAEKFAKIQKTIDVGAAVDSDTVKAERLAGGRVRFHVKFKPRSIPGFVLFLCLDETGSIGVGGAARGIEIIDTFRDVIGDNRILGIGYVAFGDILCQFQPISGDLDAVRAQLSAAVAGTNTDFFCDDGNDTPENGVDALKVALDELSSSDLAQAARFRYIALKTDTVGYAHIHNNIIAGFEDYVATINSRLLSGEVDKTFIEFGTATDDGEPQEAQSSGDWGSYAESFPEVPDRIFHSDFAITL